MINRYQLYISYHGAWPLALVGRRPLRSQAHLHDLIEWIRRNDISSVGSLWENKSAQLASGSPCIIPRHSRAQCWIRGSVECRGKMSDTETRGSELLKGEIIRESWKGCLRENKEYNVGVGLSSKWIVKMCEFEENRFFLPCALWSRFVASLSVVHIQSG